MYVFAELLQAVTGQFAGNIRYAEGLISGHVFYQWRELVEVCEDVYPDESLHFLLHVSRNEAGGFAADKFV